MLVILLLGLAILVDPAQARDIEFKKSRIVVINEEGVPEEQNVFVTFNDSAVVIVGRKERREFGKPRSSIGQPGPRRKIGLEFGNFYQDTTVVKYSDATDLFYEISKTSNTAAQILAWADLAFLYGPIKIHWFSFNYTLPDSSMESILLKLHGKEQRRFRQVAKLKIGKRIETIIEQKGAPSVGLRVSPEARGRSAL